MSTWRFGGFCGLAFLAVGCHSIEEKPLRRIGQCTIYEVPDSTAHKIVVVAGPGCTCYAGR